MNIIKIVAISLLLLWRPVSATVPIPLGNIEVKLEVTAQPKIEIEKPTGGWYNNIKLNNSPESPSLFQAEVPVTIKLRRQEGFSVSIQTPLILSRETGDIHSVPPIFSPAEIKWGKERANLRPLSATPEIFTVDTVDNGNTSQTSTDYLLHISALAPSGRDIAGKYHGQLTLIFETNS
ncbi:hypothetical protein [Yersinia mollaretii]|uniref:hypothetical protein n=1 Tax=Yersinia mollaretii TaxID=33060 RepID=UPI0005DCB00D|nr:hypothetical protein [Yersinia mollaretii]PJE87173.1 fimbrial protein [Yersinia mollaretii]CQD38390.1 alpha-related fimbriae minor subunit 2 [Yersinia mollaretii]CQH40856.1 alpha-related fimbriae minor subunit 2 [Yersinia mollaretii]